MLETRLRGRAYGMTLFILVLIVLTGLTASVFMIGMTNLTESTRSRLDSQARSLGQSALSQAYAGILNKADFRTAALSGRLPAVKRTSATLLDPGATDAQAATCGTEGQGNPCYKLSVERFFYNDAVKRLADGVGTYNNLPNPAALPTAISVRVEVFDECASIGVLTAVNCRVNGIYTQRIQPDQFYDYAFYFQYATLDPAVYSPDLSSYPAGLTSPSAQCSLRYAASTTPGYDRRSPACLSVAYQSTAAAAPYKRDVNNDGVLDDPPASDLHPNRDVIDGPLFTNDDQLVTCNSPVFRSRVYAEPTLSSTTGRTRSTSYSRVFQRLVPASGDQFVGCSASNFPILVGGASDQSQTPADAPGTRFGLKRASSEILLPNRQQFQEVATAVAGSARVSGTIALRPGRDSASSPYTFTEASYNGGEYTRVSNGFIYASGNTRVSGTYAGALSIYAEGEATISADLFGVRPSGDTCVALASQRGTADVDENGEGSNSEGRGGRGDGIIDDCRSVLGLTAGGKINIEQNAGGGRKVQAILVSLDNSPSVPQWYEEQPWAAAGTSPTLEFYGAMASKYQGIFGGYSSDETAKLLSGYRKDFHFDRRLTEGDLTPPFLPGPVVTDSWSRVDFSEAYRAD